MIQADEDGEGPKIKTEEQAGAELFQAQHSANYAVALILLLTCWRCFLSQLWLWMELKAWLSCSLEFANIKGWGKDEKMNKA